MTQSRKSAPSVYVVDDDASIRHAMALLLKSIGQPCEIYESGSDFLDAFSPEFAGCLVLDIRMPGIGGLELQDKLEEIGCTMPIIFITGYGDVPMAVDAMRKGAFDFIEKPFRDQELLDRIAAALAAHSERREQHSAVQEIEKRLARLTPREREVFELVVTGKPNKIVAHDLGVSQRTVEIHRSRVMEKMQAKSLAELVRMHIAN